MQPGPVVTFGLGEALFALPVALVQEILDPRPVARLPNAPPHMLGVIDVRGHSVAVVDLRSLLREPPRPDQPDTRIMVLQLGPPKDGPEDGPEGALEGGPEGAPAQPGPTPGPTPGRALGSAAASPRPPAPHAAPPTALHVALRVDRVIEVTGLDHGRLEPLAEAAFLDWDQRMVEGLGRRNGAFVTVLRATGLFDPTTKGGFAPPSLQESHP